MEQSSYITFLFQIYFIKPEEENKNSEVSSMYVSTMNVFKSTFKAKEISMLMCLPIFIWKASQMKLYSSSCHWETEEFKVILISRENAHKLREKVFVGRVFLPCSHSQILT